MAETKKFYVVGENGAKSTPWGFSTFLEFDGLLWRIRKTVREGIANAEERRALLEHIRKVRRVLKHISENPEELSILLESYCNLTPDASSTI